MWSCLAERAATARQLVYDATGNPQLREEIAAVIANSNRSAGAKTCRRSAQFGDRRRPADRAASPASTRFLNVRGEDEVVEACRRCFASIFT